MSDQSIGSPAQLEEIRQRLVNVELKLNMLIQREVPLDPCGFGAETFLDNPDQLYGNRTYAQHGDDLIILNIFNTILVESPSYMDIGAHHPFRISNTALLYQRGSRGINVEANPSLIGAFYTQRPKDINLNVGVSNGEAASGKMRFYMFDDTSGLNTFDEARAREVEKDERFKIQKIIDVPVMTVTQIIKEYCEGVFPDLLTMDVEGLELSILKTIEYNVAAPKVICVEANTVEHRSFIKNYLNEKNYSLRFVASANMFFTHERFDHFFD